MVPLQVVPMLPDLKWIRRQGYLDFNCDFQIILRPCERHWAERTSDAAIPKVGSKVTVDSRSTRLGAVMEMSSMNTVVHPTSPCLRHNGDV